MLSTWLYRKVAILWHAMQVELHGRYSSDRLVALHRSIRGNSPLTRLAMLLTPLPSIILVAIVDIPHLAPLDVGPDKNSSFWVRGGVVGSIMAFMLLDQLRVFVPRLNTKLWHCAAIAALAAINAILFTRFLSHKIGFPVPFTLVIAAPVFIPTIVFPVAVILGRQLQEHQDLRREFRQFSNAVALQTAITTIYPAIYHIYSIVPRSGQFALMFGLAAVKITLRTMFARLVDNLADVRPTIVVVNVEIFHALFSSNSAQTTSSPLTIVVMIVMDGLYACVSDRDIRNYAAQIRQTLQIRERDRFPPLIDSAVYLLRNGEQARRRQVKSALSAKRYTTSAITPAEGLPSGSPGLIDSRLNANRTISLISFVWDPAPLDPRVLTPELSDEDVDRLDSLAPSARTAFVEQVQALLHLTEFVMLMEYVEIAIPVVSAVSLAIRSVLPNRDYYPVLQGRSQTVVLCQVGYGLLYSSCELISLILIAWRVRRHVQYSPKRQVSFVLSVQWHLVQITMVLWIVYTTQANLEHFGVDFSFRFKWLHP